MAYTLTDLISRVQRRVKDIAYSTSEITEYINDTQRDIFNEYRLPFMESSQNYTFTSGVGDITNGSGLPDNYDQAIDLVLTTSGTESLLNYKSYQEMNLLYPDFLDTTTYPPNIPTDWYKFGSTIRVHPAPNSAYTATLYYIKKPTELTAGSDVPEIPANFGEILVVGAAYRVLQVKDNYDQAGVLDNKYQELLDKMAYRYSQTQAGHPTIMRINRYATDQSN